MVLARHVMQSLLQAVQELTAAGFTVDDQVPYTPSAVHSATQPQPPSLSNQQHVQQWQPPHQQQQNMQSPMQAGASGGYAAAGMACMSGLSPHATSPLHGTVHTANAANIGLCATPLGGAETSKAPAECKGITVKLSLHGDGRVAAHAPYSDDFKALMKSMPGREWDKDAKAWTFPQQAHGMVSARGCSNPL